MAIFTLIIHKDGDTILYDDPIRGTVKQPFLHNPSFQMEHLIHCYKYPQKLIMSHYRLLDEQKNDYSMILEFERQEENWVIYKQPEDDFPFFIVEEFMFYPALLDYYPVPPQELSFCPIPIESEHQFVEQILTLEHSTSPYPLETP